MTALKIASGVVHKLPPDLRARLAADPQALRAWEDISSIARNEWICWIESAKKAETRMRRIERAIEDLSVGKRRPCCWPGCPHR
ncbi:MAG: YdeI/OmpD-associated family protein [Hyphomicrobium sp.]|nr:YdeI/OmpD-associated family protein [Hyphomicrobium sp.]